MWTWWWNIPCIVKNQEMSWVFVNNKIRKLTPVECERLQWVKDNYTSCVSNSQRYKMLGNWWTIPVIEHILKQTIKWSMKYRDNYWNVYKKWDWFFSDDEIDRRVKI